ncbi:conserved Plasmodium protein, unknown function [Plasmodium sp. DRC-Itaito]|nr:conserved Plasmodium protein, unknown function [Plasmodium sp. DRC-Itaito]
MNKRHNTNEKIIFPLFNGTAKKPVKSSINIKSLYELKNELNCKIYTNIYTYNTLFDGIFLCRGVNNISGKKNCGKSSMCYHICINLFFNDLLHYFHLFYSSYFSFDNFLHKKNIHNVVDYMNTTILGDDIIKEFIEQQDNFKKLLNIMKYFVLTFKQHYGKNNNVENKHNINNNTHIFYDKHIYQDDTFYNYHDTYQSFYTQIKHFYKRKVIYIDLDNSFFIDRYKNMIYSSLEKIKKLMHRYIQFCSEKKVIPFLLLLEKTNKYIKEYISFNIYKNYSNEFSFFIDIFNHYLFKYIYNISFSHVFNNLQLLKIFNFFELINVINYIYQHIQTYYSSSSSEYYHFNKYIPHDLGIVVIDNLNYIFKASSINNNNNNNNNNINIYYQLEMLLNKLSILSLEKHICILITNNDNNNFTRHESFNKKNDNSFYKIISPYIYNNIHLKIINQKIFFEHNYPKKKNTNQSQKQKQKEKQKQKQTNNKSDDTFQHENLNNNNNNNEHSNTNLFDQTKQNIYQNEERQLFNVYSSDDDQSMDEMDLQEKDDDHSFYEKKYNLRYIKVKGKNKSTFCFFEINKYGIETILM